MRLACLRIRKTLPVDRLPGTRFPCWAGRAGQTVSGSVNANRVQHGPKCDRTCSARSDRPWGRGGDRPARPTTWWWTKTGRIARIEQKRASTVHWLAGERCLVARYCTTSFGRLDLSESQSGQALSPQHKFDRHQHLKFLQPCRLGVSFRIPARIFQVPSVNDKKRRAAIEFACGRTS